MIPEAWMSSPWFSMVLLPVLIFFGRIVDVSIGTIRVIYVGRGHKIWAGILGFFEVLIWLTIISQIMQNLTNPVLYVGYAAGFGMGNYIGMRIEEKLAVGLQAVRVITARGADALVNKLREQGIGVTVVDGRGTEGPVDMLYLIVRRRDAPWMLQMIAEHAPDAFININEVRSVRGGVFPKTPLNVVKGIGSQQRGRPFSSQNPLRRKGK